MSNFFAQKNRDEPHIKSPLFHSIKNVTTTTKPGSLTASSSSPITTTLATSTIIPPNIPQIQSKQQQLPTQSTQSIRPLALLINPTPKQSNNSLSSQQKQSKQQQIQQFLTPTQSTTTPPTTTSSKSFTMSIHNPAYTCNDMPTISNSAGSLTINNYVNPALFHELIQIRNRAEQERKTELNVGIAVSSSTAALKDTSELLQTFRQFGHKAQAVLWNDPNIVSWSCFDVVILRTSYWVFRTPLKTEFLSWLASVSNKTLVINSFEVFSWSTEHNCLYEVSQKGIPVVPSVQIDSSLAAASPAAVQEVVERMGWREGAVVCPGTVAPASAPEECLPVLVPPLTLPWSDRIGSGKKSVKMPADSCALSSQSLQQPQQLSSPSSLQTSCLPSTISPTSIPTASSTGMFLPQQRQPKQQFQMSNLPSQQYSLSTLLSLPSKSDMNMNTNNNNNLNYNINTNTSINTNINTNNNNNCNIFGNMWNSDMKEGRNGRSCSVQNSPTITDFEGFASTSIPTIPITNNIANNSSSSSRTIPAKSNNFNNYDSHNNNNHHFISYEDDERSLFSDVDDEDVVDDNEYSEYELIDDDDDDDETDDNDDIQREKEEERLAQEYRDHLYSSKWTTDIAKLLKKDTQLTLSPFSFSTLRDGELSFVFIGGMFSHSIRRLPPRGDYRTSHSIPGLRVRQYFPSDTELFFAINAYNAVASSVRDSCGKNVAPIFARIDISVNSPLTSLSNNANNGNCCGSSSGNSSDDCGMLVNNIDLVDPVMYLTYCRQAASVFVDAVVSYVNKMRVRTAATIDDLSSESIESQHSSISAIATLSGSSSPYSSGSATETSPSSTALSWGGRGCCCPHRRPLGSPPSRIPGKSVPVSYVSSPRNVVFKSDSCAVGKTVLSPKQNCVGMNRSGNEKIQKQNQNLNRNAKFQQQKYENQDDIFVGKDKVFSMFFD